MYRTQIELTSKRKPSRALIMRTIAEYLEAGHKQMELNWGENWLAIRLGESGTWHGCGWIKDISGDDIANELNQLAKLAA